MKPVDEYLAEILATVSVLAPLDLSLVEALDCVLAEDVTATVAVPRFDNSAMDGYAVIMADVAWAREDRPVRLPVVADLPAGAGELMRMVPGTAVRIMTGAPVPAGADAVVPVEWTDAGGFQPGANSGRHGDGESTVSITRAPAAGQHIRPTAEDVREGEVVLRAGTRLTARQLALMAAVGRNRARVHPRPRVAVLSTGSELVEPGKALAPGQIYDANGPALTAAALDLGAEARYVGIIDDNPQIVLSALEDQLDRSDLIITSGGVSAGAYDVVKEVLSRLGTVEFTKVAMQPGMPQGFGVLGPASTPIFALPGNPVSAMVGFEVFVRPALRKMWGEVSLHRHSIAAVAAVDWRSPPGKRQFVRAHLHRGDDAAWVTPVGGQGSHLVADLAEANCLAVVAEDVTEVRRGDVLRCLLLERARR